MKDIHNINEGELAKTLRDKREALRNFRFAISGSKLKNVKEGRTIRHDIAQILTELNARRAESIKDVKMIGKVISKTGKAKLIKSN
jgi:ribosomal protein L29